ncbi:MAG: hypothetical protein ACLU4J_13785 [Butyricimonas paravirosa]
MQRAWIALAECGPYGNFPVNLWDKASVIDVEHVVGVVCAIVYAEPE